MKSRLSALPVADLALAALFGVLGMAEILLDDRPGSRAMVLVAGVACPAALALRTTAPVPAALAAVAAYASAVATGMPVDGPLFVLLSLLVLTFSVSAHVAVLRAAVGVWVAGTVMLFAAVSVAGTELGEVGLYLMGTAIAVVAGRAVRAMGFEVDELAARNAELARERGELASRAVADERARIARELHDVIGHSISIMGVQAGAVRRRLDESQEVERDALLAVERTGRDAVAEMRRLLGFLRESDGTIGALPTMRRLDDLVADVRRSGLDVTLAVDGDLEDLSPGRALAAFRILQEALTNALKHAPGSHVEARLTRTAAEVEIEVTDDGREAGSPDPGGHGLVGMRERVAMYGGELDAGPLGGRGFGVRARIPLSGA